MAGEAGLRGGTNDGHIPQRIELFGGPRRAIDEAIRTGREDYGVYVHERHLITQWHFIERSTALPAGTVGLCRSWSSARGRIRRHRAFDPEHYAAHATNQQPTLFATGVRTVVVKGVLAVEDSALTGAAAGQALPHTLKAGTCR